MTNNSLIRPIFGIFPDKNIKIGQLFDLQDESFLPSSVLKTELLPAIRIFDEKYGKIEIFYRPILAEFISSLSDDLLTQLKAYANFGIFNTLTTDTRIITPNSDALISIKFVFRKKILKLREIDANALELDETFISKSQFAVTEIEMGQWILVSVSLKNFETEVVPNLEPIHAFLENYFSNNNEIPEIPSEVYNFLFKIVTSETVFQSKLSEYISFKEFFENLKSIYDKHRCFPISVKMTSLLDLGLFTIDNRLETLQRSFECHEFFLKFFRETEMAIFKLQQALTSHLKIFTVIILKKLRQSEIYLAEIMDKFKKLSIYDKPKLELLQTEIENSRFLPSNETFIQSLESQFVTKQSNFVELETQKLFNLSPTKNVKFALIIGESEKQKTDFINFLINISHCSTVDEAVTYKMTTFLPYSNLSTRKAIILTKNNETTIFITIKDMDYCSTMPQATASNELAKIFRGERQLNTVILLFSKSSPLQLFQKWIPKQLSKMTKNFIYFNFYNKKPLKAEKWKALAEILPTGSLYFLKQKILKQNFMQMSKDDLEMGLQNIHQILRKIIQSKVIDGMEEEGTVMEFAKIILDISKEVIEENEMFNEGESGKIDMDENTDLRNATSILVTSLATLCKFLNNSTTTNYFANKFFTSSKYYIIWDTVSRLDDPVSHKEVNNICNAVITLPNYGSIFQQKILIKSNIDIITYNCERKTGISFFSENIALSFNDEKVFEMY